MIYRWLYRLFAFFLVLLYATRFGDVTPDEIRWYDFLTMILIPCVIVFLDWVVKIIVKGDED